MQSSTAPLTVIGLGPGTWESLTMEAANVLQSAPEIYVRTTVHPPFDPIRIHLHTTDVHSFDDLYESLPDFEQIYAQLAERVVNLARRPQGVVYAVPGSPSFNETSIRMVLARAREANIAVRVIGGLSPVEPVLAAVGAFDAGWVEVLNAADIALLASENAVGEVPGEGQRLPWRAPLPTQPAIVTYLYDQHTASGVKLWLSKFWPDEHRVCLVHAPGTPESSTQSVALFELDRLDVDYRTSLYIPPLAETDNVRTFSGLMQLTRALRAPGGCPWDREQSHASLKPYLLEETYEVLDALDREEPEALAEEMGDLLYQIALHSQVAAEAGTFTIEDVLENVVRKLIGRHPHVFGDLQLDSAQDVRHAWESFKQRQKPKRSSVLESIPSGLPALPKSNLIQKRAASVGAEWSTLGQALDKADEELAELRREVVEEAPHERQMAELGDALFALVSVARFVRVDPEEALRRTNTKFAARFQYIERASAERGVAIRDLPRDQLDVLWNEAKSVDGA